MAKIIIVRTCNSCTGIPCKCELFNPLTPPPKECPLQDAPDVMVFKGEQWTPGEEGDTFFDDVFAALEFKEVHAYLEEINDN